MKKSLLALAVLGAFAGVASAQSSVTIYGVIDLGIQKTNGGTATNPGVVQGFAGKAYHERQSTPSRLGFRGNEDLGGGLSAQFQIEHRFEPDTSQLTNPATFWQGRTYVQLTSAQLGSVYLGREYAPSFWVHVKADPFGEVGVGNASSGLAAGFNQFDLATAPVAPLVQAPVVRTSNTVGYKSPSFSGLTAQIAGSLSEASGTGRQYGGNVEYLQGPIWASAGYDKRTRQTAVGPVVGSNGFPVNPGTTVGNNNSLANIAAAYDFGFVRPVVYYARSKTGLNGNFTNNVWMVGATAPLVGGKVKAMYYRLDLSDAPGALNVNNNDQKKLGLGYDYPLSKRTNLYADVGYAREQTRSTNKAGAFGITHTF